MNHSKICGGREGAEDTHVVCSSIPFRVNLQVMASRKKQTKEKLESESRISFLDYLIECQKEDARLSDEEIRSNIDTFIMSVSICTYILSEP